MPTEEELEQLLTDQIDKELFTEDEKRMIHGMLMKDMGARIVQKLAEETVKGGDVK